MLRQADLDELALAIRKPGGQARTATSAAIALIAATPCVR
jgi:hypothetical protein